MVFTNIRPIILRKNNHLFSNFCSYKRSKRRFFSNYFRNMSTRSNIILSLSEKSLQSDYNSELSYDADISVLESSLNSNEFLLKEPVGCYSSARTLDKFSIVGYQNHLDRLLLGASKKVFSQPKESHETENIQTLMKPLRTSDTLYPLITELCRKGLKCYFLNHEDEKKLGGKILPGNCPPNSTSGTQVLEVKLTILIAFDLEKNVPLLKLHVSPLKVPKGPTCEVSFFGQPRTNPDVKDSQWVRDRTLIEKEMKEGMEEVLLVDSITGAIYEGMSSNFFAVVDSSLTESGKPEVWTAPFKFVLKGTIMNIILDGCHELGIPVQEKTPNLQDAANGLWKAAFISSTSRLLLPIAKIHPQDSSSSLPTNSVSGTIDLAPPMDQPYIAPLLDYVNQRIRITAQKLI